MATTTITKTVILEPGETFSLPPGATLTFVSDPDGLDSQCADIPEVSYKCGYFQISVDDDNATQGLDELNTTIDKITADGFSVTLNQRVITSGDNPGTPMTLTQLNANITSPDMFVFKAITRDGSPSKYQLFYLFFTIVESLYDSLEMKVISQGPSVSYYKPNESACDSYGIPEL